MDEQTRSLRAPSEPSSLTRNFGHDEQRNALHAGRGVGQARQHQMDDVPGDVVLAPGDEDLRAADPINVALGNGSGAHGGEIGAGLRLGQVHRAGPGPRDHVRQIELLLGLGAVMVNGGDGAERQHLAQRKGQIGRRPHFQHRRRDQARQALAAIGERRRHGVPAVLAKGREGRLDAVRRGHHAVLADAALLVAGMVQRRQHVAGEFARLLENRLDQIVGGVLVTGQSSDAVEAADFLHGEDHVADRRAIGGHGSSSGKCRKGKFRLVAPARADWATS